MASFKILVSAPYISVEESLVECAEEDLSLESSKGGCKISYNIIVEKGIFRKG
jgi:hypothetical protein